MATVAKYKTKKFECWNKAKELRLKHYMDVANAKEQGKLLIFGCAGSPYPLLAGLGDFVFFGGEPYGASVSWDRSFSAECMKATEAQGYASTLCSYYRNTNGSMFLDKFYFTGGPFPKPDFIWSDRCCPCGHPKAHKIMADHFGIPIYAVDNEFHHQRSGKMEQRIEYEVGQYLDSIEWMEKITGRTFDDEKAIEGMRRLYKIERLWAEINLLNRTIPAPVDLKSYFAFVPIQMNSRYEDSSVEFLEILLDELRDRVANGIAAVPNESIRLGWFFPPPWSFLKMFRVLEDKGVAFVMSFLYMWWGKYEFKEDGNIEPERTPEERGWPERNREEMIRNWVRYKHEGTPTVFFQTKEGGDIMIQIARFFRLAGVPLGVSLGCPPTMLGLVDYKRALEKAGIPTTILEYDNADFRSNDDVRVLSHLETFVKGIQASRTSSS